MATQFYDTYQSYSKDELFKIVLTPDDYQPAAVIAAIQVITEKNWKEELDKRLEEKREQDEEDIKEKAEYYKKAVEFQEQHNSIQITTSNIPKFEFALAEKGIEFFREDKNVGIQLDYYPTQTYYFKDQDVEAVDKITKDLGLVAAPYTDIKPFFGFEMKVIVIALVVILLLYLLFK